MKSFTKTMLMLIGSVLTVLSTPFAASAAAVDTAATGDGRIYIALGVLVIAIVVVILMLVLNKGSKGNR